MHQCDSAQMHKRDREELDAACDVCRVLWLPVNSSGGSMECRVFLFYAEVSHL